MRLNCWQNAARCVEKNKGMSQQTFYLRGEEGGRRLRANLFCMAKKVATNASEVPPDGLANPFADLKVDGLPVGEIYAAPAPATPAKVKRGRVVLRRETAHRGGKTVIVVHDFATSIPLTQIEELGRKLRNACGCGGTTRERTIELQGEQAAKIRAFLEGQGFQVAGVK
jgi:translation initiation factor 1